MPYVARAALVFGGSEGIGLAVAQRLVAAGADVVVLSRSEPKLAAALAVLEASRTGADQVIRSRAVDVTDPASVEVAVAACLELVGLPDLVVTTAGYARPGYLADLPAADVAGMVATNLMGTIHVCRAVVPRLAAGSTIVTTSSMAGLTGVFGYTVYSATKFGVVGFSEALRRELAPAGIDVRVLCPPNTRTPGFDEENRHKPAEVLKAEEKVGTLSAEQVADELIRALGSRRRRFLVIPGRSSRLAAAAIRHVPGLVDRSLRRPG